MFKRKITFLESPEGQAQIAIVRKLSEFAEKGSPISSTRICISPYADGAGRAGVYGDPVGARVGRAEPEHVHCDPGRDEARAAAREPQGARALPQAHARRPHQDRRDRGQQACPVGESYWFIPGLPSSALVQARRHGLGRY